MNLIPGFVVDKETGQLCIQLRMGGHTATLPLPDGFKDWEQARKEAFLEEFVKASSKKLKIHQPYRRTT